MGKKITFDDWEHGRAFATPCNKLNSRNLVLARIRTGELSGADFDKIRECQRWAYKQIIDRRVANRYKSIMTMYKKAPEPQKYLQAEIADAKDRFERSNHKKAVYGGITSDDFITGELYQSVKAGSMPIVMKDERKGKRQIDTLLQAWIDFKLLKKLESGQPGRKGYSEAKQAALDYYNRYKDRLHSVHDGVVTSFAREIYTHLSENFPADQLPDGNDKTCTTIRGWIGYK